MKRQYVVEPVHYEHTGTARFQIIKEFWFSSWISSTDGLMVEPNPVIQVQICA